MGQYKTDIIMNKNSGINMLALSDIIGHDKSMMVKIGSDNGLLPDGTKPLPGPMLIISKQFQ